MGNPIAKYKVGDIVQITRDAWHPYHGMLARVKKVEWTQHNNYHYWVSTFDLHAKESKFSLAEHLIECLADGRVPQNVSKMR